MTSSDELIHQGIAALKGGDRDGARQLFTQAIQQDSTNQTALLWAASVIDDATQKRQYLERAVAVNPNSEAGKRAASGLSQLPPVSSTTTAALQPDQPQPSIPDPQGTPPRSAAATVVLPQEELREPDSPFAIPGSPSDQPTAGYDQTAMAGTGYDQTAMAGSSQPYGVPPAGDPGYGIPPAGDPGFGMPPAGEAPPPKKSNTGMIIGIVAAVILIPLCICGGGFAFLTFLGTQATEEFETQLEEGGITLEEDEGGFSFGDDDDDGGPTFGGGGPLDYNIVGGGSMAVGETVTGNIDSLFDAHEWTFTGQAGQNVTITAAAAPGEDTDPRIALVDPSGTVIAENDDAIGFDAQIVTTLPADGTYSIVMDVFSSGGYELSIE